LFDHLVVAYFLGHPVYLPNDCQLFSANRRRQLRSSSGQTCALYHYTHLEDRTFAAAGQIATAE